MARTSARKSRLTDNFFDAKERLEEKLASGIKSRVVKADMKSPKLIPLMEATNRGQTVIILSDTTVNMQLGIEVCLFFFLRQSSSIIVCCIILLKQSHVIF